MTPLNKYDFYKILSDPRSKVVQRSPQSPFLNIVIGAMGRKAHLNCTLRYLVHALASAGISVVITIVELQRPDRPAELEEIADKFQTNYVFVPVDLLNTGHKFSRGAAFDIGFMTLRKSAWVMDLDSDLLMNYDYFRKLLPLLGTKATHIQPYADKRVRMGHPDISRILINHPILQDMDEVLEFDLPGQGACGGAIVVNWNAYIRVGGYDEFFYDYAPEDQMFFLKLECLNGPVNGDNYAHKGYGSYANDLFLFHLDHEKQWDKNPKLPDMEKIYNDFCALSYEKKMEYIQKKAGHFLSDRAKCAGLI